MKETHEPGYWTLERCKEKIAECGGDIILIKSKYPTLATRVYRGEYRDELKPLIKNGGKDSWTEERLLAAMKEADFNWTDLYRTNRGAWDCLSRVRRSMEFAEQRKKTSKKPCGRKPRPDFSHLVAMMHRKDEVVIPSREECLAALEAADYKITNTGNRFEGAIRRHYPDLKDVANNKIAERIRARQQEREEERLRKEREREEHKRQVEERKRKRQEEKERRAREYDEKVKAYLRGEINLSPNIIYTEEYMRQVIAECNFDLVEFRAKHRRGHTLLYTKYRHLLDLFPNRVAHPSRKDDKNGPTFEECLEKAGQYSFKRELDAADHEFVLYIRRRGWEAKISQLVGWANAKRYSGYHLARALIRQATDYDEFVDNYPRVYSYILRVKSLREALIGHFNGLLREKHHNETSLRIYQEGQSGYRATMGGKDIYRVIYACEFPDGNAYVGLTCDPARRKKEHGQMSCRGESAVASYKYESGLDFEFKILTEFIPENEAVIAEGEWERKYEEAGWKMLNRAATGSLGSSGMYFNYWEEVIDKELKPAPDVKVEKPGRKKKKPLAEHIDCCTFEVRNSVHDAWNQPSYCAEEMATLVSSVRRKVFLESRWAKISQTMLDRWEVKGFVLEECEAVRRVLFDIYKMSNNGHIRYKSVGDDLKKDMKKARALLKPSKLYELLGISNQQELQSLLGAVKLEHSMTKEQRKAVNDFMHRLNHMSGSFQLPRKVMQIIKEHDDQEIVFIGLKTPRVKEKNKYAGFQP